MTEGTFPGHSNSAALKRYPPNVAMLLCRNCVKLVDGLNDAPAAF